MSMKDHYLDLIAEASGELEELMSKIDMHALEANMDPEFEPLVSAIEKAFSSLEKVLDDQGYGKCDDCDCGRDGSQ